MIHEHRKKLKIYYNYWGVMQFGMLRVHRVRILFDHEGHDQPTSDSKTRYMTSILSVCVGGDTWGKTQECKKNNDRKVRQNR